MGFLVSVNFKLTEYPVAVRPGGFFEALTYSVFLRLWGVDQCHEGMERRGMLRFTSYSLLSFSRCVRIISIG